MQYEGRGVGAGKCLAFLAVLATTYIIDFLTPLSHPVSPITFTFKVPAVSYCPRSFRNLHLAGHANFNKTTMWPPSPTNSSLWVTLISLINIYKSLQIRIIRLSPKLHHLAPWCPLASPSCIYCLCSAHPQSQLMPTVFKLFIVCPIFLSRVESSQLAASVHASSCEGNLEANFIELCYQIWSSTAGHDTLYLWRSLKHSELYHDVQPRFLSLHRHLQESSQRRKAPVGAKDFFPLPGDLFSPSMPHQFPRYLQHVKPRRSGRW